MKQPTPFELQRDLVLVMRQAVHELKRIRELLERDGNDVVAEAMRPRPMFEDRCPSRHLGRRCAFIAGHHGQQHEGPDDDHTPGSYMQWEDDGHGTTASAAQKAGKPAIPIRVSGKGARRRG